MTNIVIGCLHRQVDPVLVLKATARENAAWVHGASPAEATDAAQNVRDVFYVRTPEWQESVLSRGVDALDRSVGALGTKPGAFKPASGARGLQ
jgi:hypothetical protein